MAETKQQRWTPHNPLGVIALFVFLIETVATVSLHAVAEKPFAVVLVWFIVLYPVGIAASFFVLLWHKREALFGPMDFDKQENFITLLQKVERIEVKQDVAGMVDQSVGIDDVLRTVDRLIELDDPLSALYVGRAFFNRAEYDKSIKVFEHLKTKLKPSSEVYYRLLANLAYAQIGLNRNPEAIKNLVAVKKIRGEAFRPWHALALAYAHLKCGHVEECERWMTHARDHGADELDLEFFEKLYPEMADRIRSLAQVAA
jgi:tetratricopeptide (TPR) repeat protein